MSPATDDLLLPLLEGAFEERRWERFLDQLRERTGADYASLIFRAPAPARASLIHLYSGEPSPPALERLYRDRIHLRDPLPYHQLDEGRVYRLEEFLDAHNIEHQAYYREMLLPSRMRTVRLMRIVEPGGLNVWLTISRAAGDFADADACLLSSLAPYLRIALRNHAALERERFAATLAGEAIRRLDYGWLMLDDRGRVIDGDPQGRRMLDGPVLGQDAGGGLATRRDAMGRELAATIRAMLADAGARPRAMILSRDPWLEMLIARAHGRTIRSGPPPALIVYVHGDGWSSSDRCGQLAELFGLLPSEARLALALSRGLSIAEAATDLGLTTGTARTYSKQIYAKTGARGQPDLVRLIHRSILAMI